jgi:putative glutamine amidotransferase
MNRLVAVSATRRTDSGRERVAVNVAYVLALTKAGMVPLLVPPQLDPAGVGEVLDAVGGLMLTGGEDVDPATYGAPRHEKLETVDAARDQVELALFRAAHARRLPVLAICRGIQLVNVALGGTLYQDLPSEIRTTIDHRDPDGRHGLKVQAGTLLHRTVGGITSVNSRHHQAVKQLAPSLRASAWSDDGVIEGAEPLSPNEPWLLAVQWHPEDDVEAALFEGFARAVEQTQTSLTRAS